MSKVIIPCLMAWNIGSRPIWLCRAGETDEDNSKKSPNVNGTYKSSRSQNARLSERGRLFRSSLRDFVRDRGTKWLKVRSAATSEASHEEEDVGKARRRLCI